MPKTRPDFDAILATAKAEQERLLRAIGAFSTARQLSRAPGADPLSRLRQTAEVNRELRQLTTAQPTTPEKQP